MIIVARYGEIHLKGKNRGYFLRVLTRNLRERVGNICEVKFDNSRFIFSDFKDGDVNTLIDKISKTFGIVNLSPCTVVTHDKILEHVAGIKTDKKFRVNVNRADKNFAVKSGEFAAKCGGVILDNNKSAVVDLFNPEYVLNIDIRENDTAYIYDEVIVAVGGLPVGVSGRAMVLLSGGIDSPVAAYNIAKRGMSVDCIHFVTPPYTSDMAVDKVKRIVSVLENYCGHINLHVVPITDFMQTVKSKCDPTYTITLMRREMVRTAVRLARENGCDCLCTGENLAQVASQTIEGITTTNAAANGFPILRPLITYDKSEISKIAENIGTYKISIEQHEDCCTVFVPSSPVIKPTVKKCEFEERKLGLNN